MNFSGVQRDSALGRLLRLPLSLIPREARLPILQGTLRGKKWIVGAGTHGCWLGSYEYDKRILFEQTVQAGMTVFDIGAHAGFYTMLASVLVGSKGHVVAFEPLPRNLRYLREHLRLNRVQNAQVVEAAVADAEGVATFDPGAESSLGRLSDEGPLEVRTVVLDAMIEKGELPAPDVIKSDVEGAESRVLAGASRTLQTRGPIVFLATHGKEQHRICTDLLRGMDYQVRGIDHADPQLATELLFVPATAQQGTPGS